MGLQRRIFRVLLLLALLIYWPFVAIAYFGHQAARHTRGVVVRTKQTQESALSELGWVPYPRNGTICGGYFQEPAFLHAYPKPSPTSLTTAETIITADRRVILTESGRSTLEGNVTVTQPGRELVADKAYLYRNAHTGKIDKVVLIGHVRLREFGKVMVAKRAEVDLKKNTVSIDHLMYRLAHKTSRGFEVNAWGRAKRAHRDSARVVTLHDATYSTCSPDNVVWRIEASLLKLDRKTGRGSARNARLYIKNVPLVYTPYFSFSLNKERKTGFLFPIIAHNNESGLDIRFPFYINLAPNYDATLTARLLSKRGEMGVGEFRYLTRISKGYLKFSYLPNDRAFKAFKASAPARYGNDPSLAPLLTRLENEGDNRGSISFHDVSKFNSHWNGAIDVNRVTDDYYFIDFGGNPVEIYNDQLLNQAFLQYQGTHWHFLGRVLDYQTLHPITQGPIEDQYRRLPQLDLNANYPHQSFGLDYQLHLEYIRFEHTPFDLLTGQRVPSGGRVDVRPAVSLPMHWAGGYITPKIQVDAADYQLRNRMLLSEPTSITRVLPLFDVDSGLFLERKVTLFHHHYEQTLEPRVFYLFVPDKNQNDIPIFDTTLPPFSFEQMFRSNRFVGEDRIGDANQVTLALTTRLLNAYTGQEKLRASIGEIYYFRQPKVCITPDCVNELNANQHVSPLVGELDYHLNRAWSATTTLAWNPSSNQVDNGNFYFHYQPKPGHILYFGYEYVRNGDPFNSVTGLVNPDSDKNNLDRINISAAWPITQRWSVVGNWNYNISHGHPQTYFYGVEYNTCCWAVRVVASKVFTGFNEQNRSIFDNSVYVQIVLKGLAGVGSSESSSMLTSLIPGYVDNLRG